MNIQWMESIKENEVVISESLIEKFPKTNVLTIRFGSYETELTVIQDENLKNGTIGLPINLGSSYSIPTELQYECLLIDNQIYIGPVIAYLVKGRLENLNDIALSKFLPRFDDYEETKGLIFIGTKDAINIEESRMTGYYYLPHKTKKDGKWGYGEFPLPDAIYNRSFLKKSKISMLQAKLGDVIFNSSYLNLDKWRIWRNLSKKRNLKTHLPYTEKYSGFNQTKRLLDKYGALYIKARRNSRGRGIFHLSKENNGFTVRNHKNRLTFLKNEKQLKMFLDDKIVYASIVQQPVPYNYGKRVLDFRAYLQKNEQKKWTFQGVTTRISKEDSVVTNTVGRDDLLRGEEALATIYQLDKKKVLRIKNEMFELVKSAVQVYEAQGMHLADIAADIIIDENLHLWLLELQLNYASEKKEYEIPPEIFKKIMIAPFKYAKAITKFSKG